MFKQIFKMGILKDPYKILILVLIGFALYAYGIMSVDPKGFLPSGRGINMYVASATDYKPYYQLIITALIFFSLEKLKRNKGILLVSILFAVITIILTLVNITIYYVLSTLELSIH